MIDRGDVQRNELLEYYQHKGRAGGGWGGGSSTQESIIIL